MNEPVVQNSQDFDAAMNNRLDTLESLFSQSQANDETQINEIKGLKGNIDILQANDETQDTYIDILKSGPEQCISHNQLVDGTRSTGFGKGQISMDARNRMCDSSDSSMENSNTVQDDPEWLGEGWYRILGDAGTKIPEQKVGRSNCGTQRTGWMNGDHPTQIFQTDAVDFCFESKNSDCNWMVTGQVTNCGPFYVYFLLDAPECNLRYCSEP